MIQMKKEIIMIRLIALLVLNLAANAVGLLVAAIVLSGFRIDVVSFIFAVAIFTIVEVIADPLITKLAITNLPALRGSVALVTTFVGLFITTLISNGIQINGLTTWILASLIVWLFALIASLVLPLVVFKKTLTRIKE
jgi:putative membrane protein